MTIPSFEKIIHSPIFPDKLEKILIIDKVTFINKKKLITNTFIPTPLKVFCFYSQSCKSQYRTLSPFPDI